METPPPPPPQPAPPATAETGLWRRAARVPWWLRLIALGKLAKSLGFLILGLAAAKVAALGVEDSVARWLAWVHLDPGHGYIGAVLDRLQLVSPQTLRHFGIGFFIYATVLAIEGVGLWFDRAWAEWLVIGVASALIPFELYELAVHPTLPRASALVVNLAIVAALGWRLRAKHRAKLQAAAADVRG
jgi:uncharacterized membrane protein (DUF2068 family)